MARGGKAEPRRGTAGGADLNLMEHATGGTVEYLVEMGVEIRRKTRGESQLTSAAPSPRSKSGGERGREGGGGGHKGSDRGGPK
jgi:hypothetical protein